MSNIIYMNSSHRVTLQFSCITSDEILLSFSFFRLTCGLSSLANFQMAFATMQPERERKKNAPKNKKSSHSIRKCFVLTTLFSCTRRFSSFASYNDRFVAFRFDLCNDMDVRRWSVRGFFHLHTHWLAIVTLALFYHNHFCACFWEHCVSKACSLIFLHPFDVCSCCAAFLLC